MEPPVVPDGEVTQAGAGHRAVSLGDVEKARRASVLAYCARICDPARIAEAADAAFAELHARLEAAPSYQVVELDRMLLETTRDAAASRVDTNGGSAGGRRLSRRSNTCSLMPTLLAARESGRLSASDRAGVERHIAKCAACREIEQRREEAEQAYTALIGAPVEPEAAAEPFAPGDPEPEVSASRSESLAQPEGGPQPEGVAEPEGGPQPEGVAEPEDRAEPEREDPAEPEELAQPEDHGEPADLPQPEATEPDREHLPKPEADEPYGYDETTPSPFSQEDEEPPTAEDSAERDDPDEDMDFRLYDPPEFDAPVAAGPGHTEEFDVEAALEREDRGLDVDPDDPRAKLPTWRDGSPIGGTRTARRRPGRGPILALFIAGVVILAVGLLQLGGDDDSGGTQSSEANRQTAAAPATAAAQPAEPQPSRAELRRRARLRSLGDRELGPGTEGDDVKALQKLLGVSPTGTYGELTTFAVSDFQSKHGLPATGIADEATKRKLARRSKPPQQAPVPPEQQGAQAGQSGQGSTGQGQATPPAGTTPQGQAPQPTTPPAGQAPGGQPSAGQ